MSVTSIRSKKKKNLQCFFFEDNESVALPKANTNTKANTPTEAQKKRSVEKSRSEAKPKELNK